MKILEIFSLGPIYFSLFMFLLFFTFIPVFYTQDLLAGPEETAEEFMDRLEARLEDITNKTYQTYYAYYSGKPADIGALRQQWLNTVSNEETLKKVKHISARTKDPVLKRRLYLTGLGLRNARALSNEEDAFKIQAALMSKLLSIRSKETKLRQTLMVSKSRVARKKAWESLTRLSASLSAEMKTLFKNRNSLARNIGFNNYFEYVLAEEEITKQDFLNLVNELDEKTRQIFVSSYLEEKRRELKVERVMPWDIEYNPETKVYRRRLFPAAKAGNKIFELLSSIGIDTKTLSWKIEKKKNIPFSGLQLPMALGGGAWLLVNPRRTVGLTYYRVFFHEAGHALANRFVDQSNFTFKYVVGPFQEGMADVMGDYIESPAWQKEFTKLSEEEINKLIQVHLRRELFFTRVYLTKAVFEYQACQNPDQDLDKLYAGLAKKYLLIEEGDFKNGEDYSSAWALDPYYLENPVYYQNYILARLISAQIRETLTKKFKTTFNNKEIGPFLIKNIYSPGNSMPWPKILEQTTGQPLTTAPYLEKFKEIK